MALRQSLPAQDRKLMPEGRLSGPMPWVIAIMVFLTVLAAAAGLALASASAGMGRQLARQATVQILQTDPAALARERTAAAAALAAMPIGRPGASRSAARGRGAAGALVRRGDIASDIPLPGLIDLSLKGPADGAALGAIRARLAKAAPSARVDADGAWLDPVLTAMRSLQWLALALILLLAVATAATVVLAARSSLGNHRGTIAIVHLLGGTDLQISRLFQRRMALDAAFGSALGFAAGIVMLILIARQLSALDTPMTGMGAPSPFLLGWLIAIPVLTVLMALLMARLTILGALRKML